MIHTDLPQKPPYIGKLNTIKACRLELARVYRDARTGEIEPSEGTKLAFILAQIVKMIEGTDLETRLVRMEDQLERIGQTSNEQH